MNNISKTTGIGNRLDFIKVIRRVIATSLLATVLTLPASAEHDTKSPKRQPSSEDTTGEESVAAEVMIRGTVVDAGGAAVSGAEVLVCTREPFPGEKQFEMEPIAQAITGPDGSFEVTIKQGSFNVTARAKGMLADEGFGGRTGDREVIDGMVVRLKPIARAKGCVLDSDGRPVAGQLVRFNRSYGYGSRNATKYEEVFVKARGRFSVVTDEHGRFEITSPADTGYTVTIPFLDYMESHEVTDGAEILLQLGAGEVAAGRVVLDPSTPPVIFVIIVIGAIVIFISGWMVIKQRKS